MTPPDDASDAQSGPWNPGIESPVPRHLRHLQTIFRPENVFTRLHDAEELRDLTGLELAEIVAFRPERLALHELLVRVTAEVSVPDGPQIEDLGINFRQIVGTILKCHVEPQLSAIASAYDDLRGRVRARIEAELAQWMQAPAGGPTHARQATIFDLFPFLRRRHATALASPPESSGSERISLLGARTSASSNGLEHAAYRALHKVLAALLARHGSFWGPREAVASLATDIACNDYGSEVIGKLIEPMVARAVEKERYRTLSRQEHPVVMNTKGPSASGKSTLRPLQRALAERIGVDWGDFALISPDIWRKQLLDYGSLGPHYKYGGAFTADELHKVDQKLDRYMARKAEVGHLSHLLIDRFRFDSFAPDSDEAGSNLLTRFGQIVYMFFLVTPPASLVERAWKRGLQVGRYKSVDDILAHSVEAYAGMPQLFFTWIARKDKRVHFEFLDNSVPFGEPPRTIAFGWNDRLNVLDVGGMLDIERFRRVDVGAKAPEALYPEPALLAPEKNTAFLEQSVGRFGTVDFAERASGRIYLRLSSGRPIWADRSLLQQVLGDPDTRAGVAAVAPAAVDSVLPAPSQPAFLARDEATHTLGAWGSSQDERRGRAVCQS